MVGVEAEVRAAVLVVDPGLGIDDAGPEAHVVRLDEADGVAVARRRREIDRPAAARDRRRRRASRPRRIDRRGELGRVVLRDQALERDRRRTRGRSGARRGRPSPASTPRSRGGSSAGRRPPAGPNADAGGGSNRSRMLRISSATMPELFGGWRRDPDARGSRSRSARSRSTVGSRGRRPIGDPAAASPRAWRSAELARRRSRRTRRRRSARACRKRRQPDTLAGSPRPTGRAVHPNKPAFRPIACRTAARRLDRVDEAVPRREAAAASSMAGASRSARGRRPNRAWASAQERTAPGTVIAADRGAASGLEAGRSQHGRDRRAADDRPDPLSASSRPAAASQISQNASPPIPQASPSTTARTALVAIAASTADPPARRIPRPASLARWCGATNGPVRAADQRDRDELAGSRRSV